MKPEWVDELVTMMLGIQNSKEMLEFLKGLLTEGELDEVSRRVQIVKMLKKGVSQHEIARKLGVGVATVTRGSKEIQKGRFTQIL